MRRSWIKAAAAIVVSAAAARAMAIDVGEAAPELDVSEWLQGGAAKLGDDAGKKVWLVVLWGTFESDCLESMPALNKVYEKHKAEGFDIAAISTEPADLVRTFLAYHKLDYRVAVDQFHKTYDAYSKDVRKLPMSWLVDKTGSVVWKGDPTYGLERILTDVLSGKFDAKHAAEVAKRQGELSTAFWQALVGGNWDELLDLCAKVLATSPDDESAFNYMTWGLRNKGDHERYKDFMRQHVERSKDDAEALRRAASELSIGSGYEWRDMELALTASKRAVELTKSGNADAIETYGRVLFMIGLLDEAIVEQKKAVVLEPTDDGHKQLLGYYEACAVAKKKAIQPLSPGKKK